MMRELGANLLRPTAANADAARSAAGRTRSPREAWERMSARGLIPDDWVQSADRRFAGYPWRPKWIDFSTFWGDSVAPRQPKAAVSESPACVEAAVTIAGDAGGVALAEASAKEMHWRFSRLMPLPRMSGFTWVVLPKRSGSWGYLNAVNVTARDLSITSFGAMMMRDGVPRDVLWGAMQDRVSGYGRFAQEALRHPINCGDAARRSSAAIAAVVAGLASRGDVSIIDERREGFGVTAGGAYYPITNLPRMAVAAALVTADAACAFASASDAGCSMTYRMNTFYGRTTESTRFDSLHNPAAPMLDVMRRGYMPCGFHLSDGGVRAVIAAVAIDGGNMPDRSR